MLAPASPICIEHLARATSGPPPQPFRFGMASIPSADCLAKPLSEALLGCYRTNETKWKPLVKEEAPDGR